MTATRTITETFNSNGRTLRLEKVTLTNGLTGKSYVFTMGKAGSDEISNMRDGDGNSVWAECYDLVQRGILRRTSVKIAGMGWHDTFFLNIKAA